MVVSSAAPLPVGSALNLAIMIIIFDGVNASALKSEQKPDTDRSIQLEETYQYDYLKIPKASEDLALDEMVGRQREERGEGTLRTF